MIKFLMTGLPRSGTTVLSGSIMTHPKALFYGELLNNMQQVRQGEAARVTMGAGWRIGDKPQQALRVCTQNEDGFQYLDGFYGLNSNANAIGFKLLYDQVLQGPNSSAWRYLTENPAIKIISTKRENILDIVCSYAKAMQSRLWHSSERRRNETPVVISIDECQQLFARFSIVPEAITSMRKSHQYLEIDYSLISDDFPQAMASIFEFLELDLVDAKPLLTKLARNTPKDEIANYAELKQHFSNTSYSQYFIY